jgi:hypothetical protein
VKTKEADDMLELVRRMLDGPWFNVRTFKRFGASRLNVDSNIAAAAAQFQANTVELDAAGGIAVHVSMVHRLGPVQYVA